MPLNPFAKKAEIEVETDNAVYRAGETVIARVRVEGEKDLTIQGARIELVCAERYTSRERERDSDGDWRTEERTTTDEDVVALERMMESGTVKAGSLAERTFTFRLPAAGPPSGAGSITAVTWKVRAVLNVRLRPDLNEEAIFAVRVPRAVGAGRIDPGERRDVDDCDLTFNLPDRNVLAGETVRGTLGVAPRSEFQVEEVRAELVRREEVPRGEGNRSETVVGRVRGGELRLTPGQPTAFPFELAVPADAFPSHRTTHASVRWYVRGVLNRRLRSDEEVMLELNVYNAPDVG